MSEITAVSVQPVDIPLDKPFEIALGTQSEAKNLFIRVQTADGAVGIGEAAPHPAVTGATRAAALAQARETSDLVIGRKSGNYRSLIDELRTNFPGMVSSNLAIEMAVLDAHCRERGIPLSELFGGQPDSLVTDITVSMLPPAEARAAATRASEAGFEVLKVKTGDDLDGSLERISAVVEGHPDADIRVDANQGWSPSTAIRFCRYVEDRGIDLTLLEQPVPAENIRGLREVRRRVDVPVAADEAVFTPADARRIVEADAVDVVNLKLAKSGLIGARRIATICRAADLDLMVGCMLESAAALHAAAHLVSGIGGVRYVDLDGNVGHTQLLGVEETGPRLDPRGPGHGVRPSIDWKS